MSGIELVVMAVGAAVSAAAAAKQGQAQKVASEYEAQALRKRADWEAAQGQMNAEIERKKADEVVSDQRARFAASGGGTGGSAAGVMAQTKAHGEFNALLTQAQGTEAAAGLQDQAAIKQWTGREAQKASMIGAAGTVLSGVSTFAKNGGFNSASYRAG